MASHWNHMLTTDLSTALVDSLAGGYLEPFLKYCFADSCVLRSMTISFILSFILLDGKVNDDGANLCLSH